MTRQVSYKLGRYKIIESPRLVFWWESHSGFCSTQKGRCFIEGNILIIGPPSEEHQSFLKREFLEHLAQLPAWDKTKYYCQSQSIYRCKTGGRMSFPKELGEQKDLLLHTSKDNVNNEMRASKENMRNHPEEASTIDFIKDQIAQKWNLLKKLSVRGLR
jgi:hypothetical protein